MPIDVSVIMPAHEATATVGRAAQSVFARQGVSVELVLCADDDIDYALFVEADVGAGNVLTLCRTAMPRSGPSAARNVALAQARADVIACLDADDAYAPDRLRLLLPHVEKFGVATGPTLEVDPLTRTHRIARPRADGAYLPLADICELRMPFPPVYNKALSPAGWPPIDFAEDVILNVDLFCAAGGTYPFVEGAKYIYHLNEGSRSHSPDALDKARRGYLQILDLVDRRNWPQPVRELVRRVFNEDLAAVERALVASGGGANWRSAVRDGPR